MTRLVRFSNNAVSQLAANLTISGTSLSVTPGDGAKFPSLSAGQYFMATLVKADGSTEVVKVTARSTDTLTIARAAEPVGGASTSYSFSAGDRIEARLTAGVLSDEIDRLDNGAVMEAINKSANYTLVADDVTKLVRVSTASGTTTITLPATSALTDDYDVIVAKVTGDANTVVIARTGSTDLINGASSYTIYNQWQSAWLIADRSTNTWTVISSGMSAVNTVVDAGTGNGSTPTITLSGDPGSKNNIILVIGGVYQQKATYSISGTTLTPGATIPNGVAWEAVWSAPLTIGTPSDGTVTPAKMSTGAPTWNASGNTGVGGAAPSTGVSLTLPNTDGITFAGTDGNFTTNAYYNAGWKYKTTGAAGKYSVFGSAHYWYGAASGSAGSAISFTPLLQLDKGKSLALEGATSQTGTGISFPTTSISHSSSNANTLDDYEEGTWTPILTRATTAPTITAYGYQQGKYTKVGRLVTLHGMVRADTITAGGSGANLIGGLPFPRDDNNSAWGMIGPVSYNTALTSNVRVVTTGAGGSTTLALHDSSINTSEVNENFLAGYVAFSITYTTNT